MEQEKYYLAYEERYKSVYEAGIDHWGHETGDSVLNVYLAEWVKHYSLHGKKVIEFACGEGACGVILSRLGVKYTGVDIAPAAVERARDALRPYTDARVFPLDMVRHMPNDRYDAALDVMGLHMLVTDRDREKYLRHACGCLKKGAPMLFFRESFRTDAWEGRVETFEEWLRLTGEDYQTPKMRSARGEKGGKKVSIPFLPCRPRSREGYVRELEGCGFHVDFIREMEQNRMCPSSVSVFARKK